MRRITIIGTGVIGASIGLALRQRLGTAVQVVGYDVNRQAAARARKAGALDREEWALPAAVSGASLVIVATPVTVMERLFQELGPHLPAGCVVTDTGELKAPVLLWAAQHLPKGAAFVGGHPLVEASDGTKERPSPSIFQGKPYCLAPARGVTEEAVKSVTELVSVLEARLLFVDADEHDAYVAGMRLLPHLLAVALLNCTVGSPGWKDLFPFASGAFRRVAESIEEDPAMASALCRADAGALAQWMDNFIQRLYELRPPLKADSAAALEGLFQKARERRMALEAGQSGREEVSPTRQAVPGFAHNVGSFFLGGKLMDAYRRISRGGEKDRGRQE